MKVFYSCKSLILALGLFTLIHEAGAQNDSVYYNQMHWRSIGPYRGGRTVGAAGVPQQPNVFYIGVNNGGVWKTTDYGRTWKPVFDNEPTGSIGTVVVAPSDPNIVYVGSGEGLHRPDLSVGDGIYKSTDAGKTWTHLGLRDAQQIPKIAVDAKDPNRIFVAALGHPYGANEERGIYRSLDGGKSFQKVFYIDENTGGDDVEIDPSDPNTIYATMWQAQEGPWENAEWDGTKGGIFKSTDGGNTWHQLKNGLSDSLVQAHIAIAPSNSNILYLVIGTTEENEYGTGTGMDMYRSDDKGEHWQRISGDGRPEARIGGGDAPVIAVDPKDPNTIYSASIVFWKSVDGGKSWVGLRGAPGGDDYQNVWVNPNDPNIMLVTGDQGALVTVNGGNTWSSWYNQPTAQLYHVSADNDFPYNLYSGQQESGSVGIASRGNDGEITFREWHPVGAEEYGYVVADPLNPNIVYGGKITKYNKLTGQVQDVAPEVLRSGKYRFVRTAPMVFSPIDKKTLYYAGNVLFKTNNGGNTWDVISPDLTRKTYGNLPASIGTYTDEAKQTLHQRGVIYTIAPSYKNINTIWCGTDDGLIQLTHDGGKTWNNVTPTDLTAWSKVSMMDAGHFDDQTAYAAINRIRCDDLHPYIYRTHDGGKSWQKIITGLPDEPINTIKEDPKQKGLLFAGSETQTYVSFDDGDHWQSLRLNMPASSVRDLMIKDDDLAVATHGRGFWILDDINPLRSIAASANKAAVVLFKPKNTYRVRWDMNTDTPLPPDEPAGENPPDGAIINYYLENNSANEVTLEIFDSANNLVRKYSSNDKPYEIPEVNVPLYWIRPQQKLSADAGAHRFIWDLHYQPLDEGISFPMTAVYMNTAPRISSPWVMPGKYIVQLTVDGKVYKQPITIIMDPRVKTSTIALKQQLDLSLQCYNGQKTCIQLSHEITAFRDSLKQQTLNDAIQKLDTTAALLQNNSAKGSISFAKLNGDFASVNGLLQDADVAPAPRTIDAVKQLQKNLQTLEDAWKQLKQKPQ
ncbi:MAG TPA: hypothetical protein VHB70_11535 [Parafilimonas sp.]|nr:hypothetical protein [Parafilimonas sp.]